MKRRKGGGVGRSESVASVGIRRPPKTVNPIGRHLRPEQTLRIFYRVRKQKYTSAMLVAGTLERR